MYRVMSLLTNSIRHYHSPNPTNNMRLLLMQLFFISLRLSRYFSPIFAFELILKRWKHYSKIHLRQKRKKKETRRRRYLFLKYTVNVLVPIYTINVQVFGSVGGAVVAWVNQRSNPYKLFVTSLIIFGWNNVYAFYSNFSVVFCF